MPSEPIQLEQLLTGLPGVLSARVTRDTDQVQGVHLLVDGDPGVTLPDVQTLVYTVTGRRLSKDDVLLTPVGHTAVWASGGRWQLASIGSNREGDRTEISVRLADRGTVAEGTASGDQGRDMMLAAEATVAALRQAAGDSFEFDLVDLKLIQVGGEEALAAALLVDEPGGGRILPGIAYVPNGYREAAARVVLDAANRAFR